MEFRSLFKLILDKKEKDNFTCEIIKKNIYRGKLYSKFIIFTELILSLTDIYLSYNSNRIDFKFNRYIIMYLIMIIVNIIYLLFLSKVKVTKINIKKVNMIIISYIVFMMCWGAIISLMDQKLYGQVMVYMVNVIACSVIYYLDNKTLLFSYFISAAILFCALPFFQQSKDVIIGHYINILIFLLYGWLASRILYRNSYNDFKSKNLVVQANEKLKHEIEENIKMHKELENANERLKEISLYDELTKVNNRRSLREFIENTASSKLQEQGPISIIMMDIDYFKLYNDKYGHVEGDKVLKRIATELNKVSGVSKGFVARYGGEEFVYIGLKTDEEEIYEVANRIRDKIYNLKIPHENSKISEFVTLSLGTTTFIPYNQNSIYEGIKNADSALYEAKTEGKNRTKKYKENIEVNA